MDAVEKLGLNPIYFLSQVLTFSILAFLMVKLLYNPILKMLDERKERIARGLEDARQAAEARAKANEEAAFVLDKARKSAQQIIADANTSAEQVRANIKTKAEDEAKKILAQAEEDARIKRDQILSEMRSQIGALAISAAQRILGDVLDENRQQALVKGFFSGVQAGQVTVLESVDLTGKKAAVTSALPLDAEELKVYRTALEKQLGAGAEIDFRTDPSILGGVIIQVGDQVVDDSVAGKLGALKDQLVTG
ncbi:MAG: F0F1 ATP synthase subunit B [Anaerolineales bacterium]|nr:F0F1 ATP synthase subunit B [Anaerolineales bacterium]